MAEDRESRTGDSQDDTGGREFCLTDGQVIIALNKGTNPIEGYRNIAQTAARKALWCAFEWLQREAHLQNDPIVAYTADRFGAYFHVEPWVEVE